MTCHRTLVLLILLLLLAFGVRVPTLDSQSMWRDEVDTLCFALDFWEAVQQALGYGRDYNPGSEAEGGTEFTASPRAAYQPSCRPTPGLTRIDPSVGPWSTVRALLAMPGWNGPLYTVAMRPWIGLAGPSPFALRYSSLLFGLFAVPLTYVLGRRMLGRAVGLVGAMLVAASPHLIWYSQEAKMYGLILALGLVAIYGLRRALDNHRQRLGQAAASSKNLGSHGWWAVTVVATTLAMYSHILAAMLIPLQVALGLIWWPRTREHLRGAFIALACLTLPYLPLLAWQARSWLLPEGQATLFAVRRLDVMLEATFDGWAGQFVAEPWATLILTSLALLALFGLGWIGLYDKETQAREIVVGANDRTALGWRELLALLTWIFLPLVGIWLLSARQPLFTNRYLIWAAPSFYLLAAAGCIALVRLGRGGALVSGLLLLAVLVGDGRALVHQATQPIKPDFKGAAAYLELHHQPGDLIVFHLSYMADNFDYYFSGPYDGWGAPASRGGLSGTELDFHMRSNTSGHRTVWLVLSESEMWDPQGQIKAWMDTHAVAPAEEQVFAHVSVYRYQLDR